MFWQAMGRALIIFGIVIVVIGLVCVLLGKLNFTGLPGDITVKKGNFTFMFPIVSCLGPISTKRIPSFLVNFAPFFVVVSQNIPDILSSFALKGIKIPSKMKASHSCQ